MNTSQQKQLPDNTPVIVGAGQYVQHLTPNTQPPFNSPMQLAATAARSALVDAGAPDAVDKIDTIAIIRLFSDAAKAWQSPFGGSNNPPESVARMLGASPQHRIYSTAGGTQPLQLLSELFLAIARGEKELVLLAGAEAIANQRFALRNGIDVDWREEFDVPLDSREYVNRFASTQELHSGMSLPVHYYALIENCQAYRLGHSQEQHRRHMAQLMAPFSEVAAANPYSQFKVCYTPEQLAQTNKANYPISLPYSKLLIAQDAVNQAAALLLTSAGNARRMGIDPMQWIFLESYVQGMDQYLSQREDPGRSVAMERVIRGTLDMAATSGADMDLLDIYSCFPCAVHAACEVLDLPDDASRRLTVTGGLPYFGGPGNNYSMHALAEMAQRLRRGAGRGLVSANGGILSKHAAAVLSNNIKAAQSIDWATQEITNIDTDSIPLLPVTDRPEQGEVVSYTVIQPRDKPHTGIVLAQTEGGERFLAQSTEPATVDAMVNTHPIGRRVSVRGVGDGHHFTFPGT